MAGKPAPTADDPKVSLELRPEEHAVLVDGRPLSLTVRESQLLATLAMRPQRIMTREELYAEVWGGTPRHADRSSTSTSAGCDRSSARLCPNGS